MTFIPPTPPSPCGRRFHPGELRIAAAMLALMLVLAGLLAPVAPSHVVHTLAFRLGMVVLPLSLALLAWRITARMRAPRPPAAPSAEPATSTDPLTGLFTRHSLPEAAEALATRAASEGRVLAVLIADIDNFKHINEFHGRTTGDAILTACAARIAACLPQPSLLARLGGDQFVAVVPMASGQHRVLERLGQTIAQQIASAPTIAGYHDGITVSLGVAPGDEPDAPGFATLLRRADIALYQAKRAGRSRVMWFNPAMDNALRHHSELESGLREGLQAGEFVPWYQPIVALATGRLVGFEMQPRWCSARFGLIGPEEFLPIAEETGAITDLSQALLTRALADARDWPDDLHLAVNIAPAQLRDPWFAQKLLKLVHTSGLPAHRLVIEISETCLHDETGGVMALLSSLRNQGIGLCLDDFGTGFSTLMQLRNLRFDRIKLHRDLLVAMQGEAESRAIVESMIALCRGFGLPMMLEGVDTPEMLAAFDAPDAFHAQGLLFGAPAPAAEAVARAGHGEQAPPHPVRRRRHA